MRKGESGFSLLPWVTWSQILMLGSIRLIRASPPARHKQTLSDRLRPSGRKMRLTPPLAARRIVTRASAATQTRRIFALGLRLRGRCADAKSVRSRLYWARLAASLYRGYRFCGHRRGQRFRVCVAAFAMALLPVLRAHWRAAAGLLRTEVINRRHFYKLLKNLK